MKLLAPERIFMLRGNHECRSLQKDFTFHSECIDKFGSENGEKIFEAFNKVFEYMPLCAIIDEVLNSFLFIIIQLIVFNFKLFRQSIVLMVEYRPAYKKWNKLCRSVHNWLNQTMNQRLQWKSYGMIQFRIKNIPIYYEAIRRRKIVESCCQKVSSPIRNVVRDVITVRKH